MQKLVFRHAAGARPFGYPPKLAHVVEIDEVIVGTLTLTQGELEVLADALATGLSESDVHVLRSKWPGSSGRKV